MPRPSGNLVCGLPHATIRQFRSADAELELWFAEYPGRPAGAEPHRWARSAFSTQPDPRCPPARSFLRRVGDDFGAGALAFAHGILVVTMPSSSGGRAAARRVKGSPPPLTTRSRAVCTRSSKITQSSSCAGRPAQDGPYMRRSFGRKPLNFLKLPTRSRPFRTGYMQGLRSA